MPSFEFVIPDNFLFIPANLSYISFSFFISFILFRIFRIKILFFLFLLTFLSFAYGDIFCKYLIKSYYEISQKNSTIYEYPKKNINGKIDSLSTVKIYNYPLKFSNSLTSIEKENISNLHENYIERFIDITTYSYRYNRYVYNNERISLNNHFNLKNDKARYKIVLEKIDSFLPTVYEYFLYKFIDTQTGKVIASAYLIDFLIDNNKFRNKYLYWSSEKEKNFNLNSIQNFETIYKELFINGN